MKHFDMQIPQMYILDDEKRKTILKYDRMDASDGIYPTAMLNWEEINAINSISGKRCGSRSPKNLDKTKNLYPLIYETIKDMNVSIRYGSDPKKIPTIFKDFI